MGLLAAAEYKIGMEEDTEGGGTTGPTGVEGAVEDKLAGRAAGICIQGALEETDGLREGKGS